MELPFLYVHGALVWKVLLVLLVASTLAVIAALRSWLARRESRKEVAALVPTPLGEGEVVLRGKIVQGSASTLTQELEQSSERSSGLVVVHEGERVIIEGDVRVTHGSRARRWWLRPPRWIAAKRFCASTHDAVIAGDDVLVSGTLARVPEVAGYRESASRWELSGVDGPALIAACVPKAKALPLGMLRWLIGVAIFGSIWYGVLYHVGRKALDIAESRWSKLSEVAPYDALAIAAAMPDSRDKAFVHLIHQLEDVNSERVFQLRLKVIEDQGGCSAYSLFRASRFDEAAEAARRCDRNLLRHALVFAGRYHEAARTASPGSQIAAIAAIAEHRWDDAALYVDEIAKDYAERTPTAYTSKEKLATQTEEARCVAAMFRAWGGAAKAMASVDDHTAGCITAHALAAPIVVRGQWLALAGTRIDREKSADYSWIFTAAMFASVYGANYERLDFSGDDKWFVPFAIEANRDAPDDVLGRWHARKALLELQRGNLAAAHRDSDQALSLAANDKYARALPSIFKLVETSERVDATFFEEDFESVGRIRSGKALSSDDTLISPDTCRLRYADAIEAARRGDGRALAAVHRECHVPDVTMPAVLFAVLPLIERGRADLAEVLRFHRDFNADFRFPAQFLEQVWWYRETARMIGDTSEYQRWKAVYERHAAVLADRETAIAFELLNKL